MIGQPGSTVALELCVNGIDRTETDREEHRSQRIVP